MIIKPKKLKKLEDEEWLVVPDSNGRYYVSNYGRIKSFAYDKKDGIIMGCAEIKSFKCVQLMINKLPKRYYVHKLVAELWIPKPSDEYNCVMHIDRNLRNNHIANLKWITQEERHRFTGEYLREVYSDPNRPKNINRSKLRESDIIHLKTMLQRGVTQVAIAKMFCISEMQVTRIKRGENWGHIKVPAETKE